MLERLKKRWFFIPVAFAGIALFFVGLFVLPDKIGMQMQLNGGLGNYVPKTFGLLVPLLMTVGFSVAGVLDEEKGMRYLLLSILGLAFYGAIFAFNL